MPRIFARAAAVAPAALLSVAIGLGAAAAQSPKDLAGAWTLDQLTAEQDGKTVEPYGPHPKGRMMLDADGRFSITIVRAGVAKFASNNRTTGTAEENKAAVQGSLAYFGSYAVDPQSRMLDIRIEASTYPNFEGTSQKRLYTLSGDELVLTNPSPSGGGGAAKQVWKRVK